MKQINSYINEKLVINKDIKAYTCHPKDWHELRDILEERLKENKDADLNDIDVSKVKDMSNLFMDLNPHNIKIDEWDVSNVEDMSCMFYACSEFNCNLSKWKINKVENMYCMFFKCENFKGEGLENWKVNSNIDIRYMFDGCTSLKNKPSWYKE